MNVLCMHALTSFTSVADGGAEEAAEEAESFRLISGFGPSFLFDVAPPRSFWRGLRAFAGFGDCAAWMGCLASAATGFAAGAAFALVGRGASGASSDRTFQEGVHLN